MPRIFKNFQMPKKISTQNVEVTMKSDSHWAEAILSLPETLEIRDTPYQISDLSDECKKLIAIYVEDKKIISQHQELLALSRLGLATIESKIASLAADNMNTKKPKAK